MGVFDPFDDGTGTATPSPITGLTSGYTKQPSGWFGGLGGAATLFGGGLSAYGNYAKGAALKRASEADADALEAEVDATSRQASATATQRGQKLAETLASQRALQASRGIALDGQGTPENIRATTQATGDLDISNMWLATTDRIAQLNFQKAALLTKGNAAAEAGGIGAAASLLTAAGSTGGSQLIKGAIGVVDSGNWIEDGLSSVGSIAKEAGSSILEFFGF